MAIDSFESPLDGAWSIHDSVVWRCPLSNEWPLLDVLGVKGSKRRDSTDPWSGGCGESGSKDQFMSETVRPK